MKRHGLFFGVLAFLFVLGCENPFEKDNEITQSDADFSFEASQVDPNIIIFTANNENLTLEWDFGDGNEAMGPLVENKYLFKGTYKATLTASNGSGESVSSSQDVIH